jgi:hypothetical protein
MPTVRNLPRSSDTVASRSIAAVAASCVFCAAKALKSTFVSRSPYAPPLAVRVLRLEPEKDDREGNLGALMVRRPRTRSVIV